MKFLPRRNNLASPTSAPQSGSFARLSPAVIDADFEEVCDDPAALRRRRKRAWAVLVIGASLVGAALEAVLALAFHIPWREAFGLFFATVFVAALLYFAKGGEV